MSMSQSLQIGTFGRVSILQLTLLASIVLACLTGCGVDSAKNDKRPDFCRGNDECGSNSTCLNQTCVAAVNQPNNANLPWEGVPSHRDAAGGDGPDIPSCKPGAKQTCEGQGECKNGTQTCREDGAWGECVGENNPSVERCDNKDNDCNGLIDDGISQPCYDGPDGTLNRGPCAVGRQTCKDGVFQACEGAVLPSKESCNGIDDDCDGKIDNGFEQKGQPCFEGVETCKAKGIFVCSQDGEELRCSATPHKPTLEICDGKDNDCDGQIDEDFDIGIDCFVGLGVCRQDGKTICDPNEHGKTKCNAVAGPHKPADCSGADNDCDGMPDKPDPQLCQCTSGDTSSCFDGPPDRQKNPPCQAGTRTCINNQWGPCMLQVLPEPETCNGIDDDCDGKVDGIEKPCYSGGTGCHLNAGVYKCTGSCRAGKQVCEKGRFSTCRGEVKPGLELCDGLDNNCDGTIDEKFPALGASCEIKKGSCKSQGKYVCNANKLGVECDAKPVIPQAEICDNIDNDCDGKVDEICGADHPYAIVDALGNATFSRNAKVTPHPMIKGQSLIESTAPSSAQCDKQVLLLTPLTKTASVASFDCLSKQFKVFTHSLKGATSTLEKFPFHAVIPNNGSYGYVKCVKGSSNTLNCTVTETTNTTQTLSILRLDSDFSKGVIVFSHSACKDPRQPIFATIKGSVPGVIRASSVGYALQGKCAFQTFNVSGTPQMLDFAWWLPPRGEYAWASVDAFGKLNSESWEHIPLVQRTLYYSPQDVWTIALNAAQAGQYKVHFPSWMSPSAVILTASADKIGATEPGVVPTFDSATTSPSPTAPDLQVYTHELSRTSTTISRKTHGFHIMYVHRK